KTRTAIIPGRGGLKPGFYYLLVSHNPEFANQSNTVSYTDFWVTDLALVSRHDHGTAQVAGMVTNNRTGEPVAGAKVQVWTRENNGWFTAGATAGADKNGLYAIPAGDGRAHMVVVTHKEQQLASAGEWYTYRNSSVEQANEQTVFFTDRSLYRPGQTVQFKGITIRYHHGTDNYEAVPNRDVSVVFTDPNGKEVARHQARSNDYGSFSGSFTAPRDRLTGRMTIRAGNGATSVSVEEYKRPKFKVEVEAPKEPGRLNEIVKVPGKATQYNGVPVGCAKFTYRVTREVRYPDWFFACCCWWRPVPQAPAQEVAHGTAATEPDGSFAVAFTAKPDPSVPARDEPSFVYKVSADVTDTTGETRSASKSVSVGYAALRAAVTADPWLVSGEESTFSVSTTTLDGEGQSAKGAVKVYKLKQPDNVARPEVDGDYHPRFRPNAAPTDDPLPDPSKPESWELGDEVAAGAFETSAAGKAELNRWKLAPGAYRALLETTDRFGKRVTARYQFTVVDPAAEKFAGARVPNFVAAKKWSVEAGEEFQMLWGTGYDAGRAFVEVEHRGKVLQAFWTGEKATQHLLTVPVREDMRGGFTVRTTYVRENRAYLTSHHVDVPWTNKNLTVKWERFVNRTEPGAKETFTAVVSGPGAKRAVAEMVAALYDSSLDAYLPHDWMHRFGVFRRDHSNLQLGFNNHSKHFNHIHGHWPVAHKPADLTYRGFPTDLTGNWEQYEYFGRGGGYGLRNNAAWEGGWADGGPRAPGAPGPGGFGGTAKKDAAAADPQAAAATA
ncbi:MAG: MG2 domain-containing protein, partial [Gemmata sp.]